MVFSVSLRPQLRKPVFSSAQPADSIKRRPVSHFIDTSTSPYQIGGATITVSPKFLTEVPKANIYVIPQAVHGVLTSSMARALYRMPKAGQAMSDFCDAKDKNPGQALMFPFSDDSGRHIIHITTHYLLNDKAERRAIVSATQSALRQVGQLSPTEKPIKIVFPIENREIDEVGSHLSPIEQFEAYDSAIRKANAQQSLPPMNIIFAVGEKPKDLNYRPTRPMKVREKIDTEA